MFLCDSCLQEHFHNSGRLLESYGSCEYCLQVAVCHDIPSRNLIPKRSRATVSHREGPEHDQHDVCDQYSRKEK